MPVHVSSTAVLIIRRSKLYYTASGIVTPVGGRPVRRLREDSICCLIQFWPPDDEHIVLKTCRGIQQTYYKTRFCALSWLITKMLLLGCYYCGHSDTDRDVKTFPETQIHP